MRQPEQDLDSFLQFSAAGGEKPLHWTRFATGCGQPGAYCLRTDREFCAVGGCSGTNPGGGPLARTHPLQSEDFQLQARWSQLLDSVSELAFDGGKVGYGEFLEVLERQAKQTIFAPESRDAPVQILGPLEAAGLTFDASGF